jgi:hypothetical protein
MTSYAERAKRVGDVDNYNRWRGIIVVSRDYIKFIDGLHGKSDFVKKNIDYVKEKVYLILNHSEKCSNLIVSESDKDEYRIRR